MHCTTTCLHDRAWRDTLSCICTMQLPDDNHSALEIQAFEGRTFAELVQDKLEQNASSVMLPSILVLMYQAAMLAPPCVAPEIRAPH